MLLRIVLYNLTTKSASKIAVYLDSISSRGVPTLGACSQELTTKHNFQIHVHFILLLV